MWLTDKSFPLENCSCNCSKSKASRSDDSVQEVGPSSTAEQQQKMDLGGSNNSSECQQSQIGWLTAHRRYNKHRGANSSLAVSVLSHICSKGHWSAELNILQVLLHATEQKSLPFPSISSLSFASLCIGVHGNPLLCCLLVISITKSLKTFQYGMKAPWAH